jgi:hypothetical protein
MESDVFSLYCPLRNYLRKQKLNESLLAIHAHIQFQQFHKPLPSYITGEPFGYRNMTKFTDILNFHLFPWELSLLCKEVLLNSEMYGATHSLLEWHYLSGAVNKLKYLENETAKLYSTKDNVLLELFRISHRQFRWQRMPTMDAPARYWKIFSYQNLHAIVEKLIGLTIEEIIKIGMSLLGFYQDKIALFYPPKSELSGITQEKIDRFLAHFCIDYEELKKSLAKEQQYNEKFAYTYSSLVAYPLIRKEWNGRDAIVCPIPRYLFERITDGIYYEVCRVEGFEHPFGDAFQAYIGDVLKVLYKRASTYPEGKYGKDHRTVDWIAEDESGTLFVECKTKRLTTAAKAGLFDTTELESELGKIADAVVQVYKTMEDFKNGLYRRVKYRSSKVLYPMVVTLEDWFIYGDIIINKLDECVISRLKKTGLAEDLIVTNPYCVISAEAFEMFTFIVNKHNIKEVLEEKLKDKEKKYWEIENYLRNKYPEDIKQTCCPFLPELDLRIKAILSSGRNN